MTGFKTSFKIYLNLWIFISEIFHDFYYIWKTKLSICFPFSSFFKVIYALYLYYFDSIVGSSSVNKKKNCQMCGNFPYNLILFLSFCFI